MGKPVNLNRFRKDKARAEKKARANANAAKFGRIDAKHLRLRYELHASASPVSACSRRFLFR